MSHRTDIGAIPFQPAQLDRHAIGAGTIVYESLIRALFTALVASIPFFSVRNPTLMLSPPLLILLVIAGLMCLKAILTFRLPISVSLLDIGFAVYFALIVASVTLFPNAVGAKTALAKTAVYVGSYLCLKIMLRELSLEQIGSATRNGVFVGTLSFAVIALGCLVVTGKLSAALTRFDYYTVTLNTFRSIDAVIGSGQPDDFEGRDIMRNTVGEAFTFYFLCMTVFRFKAPLTNVFLLVMNAFLVICTFSRRAFYAIAIVVLGSSVRDSKGIKRGIFLALLMGSIVGTTLFFQENIGDNRLADFSDGGRHNQYADAIQQFSSSPFVGLGFGTKLERGSYVHNFVLGSAAMMGILGLLAALYIHATLLLAFAKGLLCPRDCNAAVFLIIPILSLTVGATFEGLFTVSGWLAITLFSVCEEKQALAIPQELEQPIGTTPFAEPIGTHA